MITLEGEFDLYGQAGLKHALEPARHAPSVIVDFSKVRYIDSSALSVIVTVHRDRIKAGLRRPSIAAANPQIKRLLSLTQVDRLWLLCDTVDEARSALEKQ